MASLMDTLNGLAQQFKTSSQSGSGGGFGDLVGGVTNALGGQKGAQNDGGQGQQNSSGGLGGLLGSGNMGGLLGSAALGTVFGALLTNKNVRKVAGNALVLGGGAVAATMAWKYFQKWNGAKGQPLGSGQGTYPSQTMPGQAPQPAIPAGSGTASPTSVGPAAAQEQEQLAETLLMAMIYAARSDGHIDEQEQANIDMVLNSMQDDGESRTKLQSLLHRPVNPDELAARVRTRDEGEDVYRLSCLIVHIDQYMERSYMDGLARALGLSDAEKADLERQAADIKQQSA